MYPILLTTALALAPAPRDDAPPAAAEQQSSARVEVPPPTEKALRYYHSGNVLWVIDVLWGLLVPCLFLFTGFSARIRDWARRVGRKWFLVIGVYFIIFAVLNYVINFPLSYYQGFIRPHDYGLSNQTFEKWLGDSLKMLAISLVVGFLFLWVPYLLLEKSPRRWWLYTGILAVPFLFFGLFIEPIWIEPLFNHFGPMKDRDLEARILALADRAGIEGGRVYEVDKSVDTRTMNAYVTGFLDTKRIVLWDTLLARLNDREVLFVMGHEMGHYVLGHVTQGMLFFSALLLLTLWVLHQVAGQVLRRFQGVFRFDRLADVASLPLMILLIHLFSLLVTPLGLAYSRHIEHEADRFGLEITQDNHAAAMSFVKFQQDDLGVPRPGLLYKLWRSSHPTLGERIDFCNDYRPWDTGQPLRYGHLFRDR